jgi:GT2 family glycosyltransferase
MTPRLTVAVCTRHRPDDLRRCLESLVRAERPPAEVEVLIIDDGDLPLDDTAFRRAVLARNYGFRCLHNPGPHGLVHGRVMAIKNASGDVILFLDDDVRIDPGYLTRIVEQYGGHPEAAGIGGVDTLTEETRGLRRAYRRLFLLDSGRPGRLSSSGFNGSMHGWSRMTRSFETEFLSGCNMSFRREALLGFSPPGWLEGYSHAEDIVLSEAARRTGPLFVDPGLKVEHHRSPESRVPKTKTAYTTVRNIYHVLEFRGSSGWAYAALFWSALGLILKDAVHPRRRHLVPAYIHALRDVTGDLWTRKR